MESIMNNKGNLIAVAFLLIVLIISLPCPAQAPPGDKYIEWLKKDAVYIITATEKRVFSQLKTDRERDLFIKMFWQERDPDENTSVNEFRDEHYRRMEYVNRHFGRGTPAPGWKTEMGRIYIILGEPHHIQNYENLSEVYPVIIWFYHGMQKYGLPDGFSVVFFKPYGSGDYELYSPVKHGPSNLLVHFTGDANDYLSAYRELRSVQKEIADVSLSLIEGENDRVFRPSIASDILVHKKIREVPEKKTNDQYAAKLLTYSEYISVDHSSRYIGSSSMVRFMKDGTGQYFLHYGIEPDKLSMIQDGGSLSTELEINCNVYNSENMPVFSLEKRIPVKLGHSQSESARQMLFAYEDCFPMIPGKYKINLLLRNRLSKEFTSFEKTVDIPEADSKGIGNLFLCNSVKRDENFKSTIRPFTYSDIQLSLSPRNDFVRDGKLILFYQILDTGTQNTSDKVIYRMTGQRGGKLIEEEKISVLKDRQGILKEISLKGLKPDYYSLSVELINSAGETVASGNENFYISPNIHLKRPWVVSNSMNRSGHEISSILGIQYSNIKDFDRSLHFLGKAYHSDPSNIRTALDYCSVLLKVRDYDRIIAIGSAFKDHTDKQRFHSFMALSYHSLGKFKEAAAYYNLYLSYYGETPGVLSSLEDCYRRAGDRNGLSAVMKRLSELESSGTVRSGQGEK